jgi:hypothetical protein
MDSSYTDLIRGFWDSARADIRVLMPAAYRPVDSFVTYDGKRAADIPPPRYAVRHLVAAEVSTQPGSRQLCCPTYCLIP